MENLWNNMCKGLKDNLVFRSNLIFQCVNIQSAKTVTIAENIWDKYDTKQKPNPSALLIIGFKSDPASYPAISRAVLFKSVAKQTQKPQ